MTDRSDPDPIAVAMSELDDAEVHEVRDHLERTGWSYGEENLLSFRGRP